MTYEYNVDASRLKIYFGKVMKGNDIELKFIKHYSRSNLTGLLDVFLAKVDEYNTPINFDALISFITDLELVVHNGIYKDLIFKEIKDLKVKNVFNKDGRIVLTIELKEW